MRRSLNTISSPFATKAPKSKTSKPSKSPKIHGGQNANQNANENSGNKCQPNNSDMPPTIPTELGTTATPAVTSTIPKHIQHPTTESTYIAEISVCSMDDSSVSKLSLQSSPSYHVTTQQTGRPNELSMAVSVSSSAVSTHQQADHRKNPFDQFIQYYPHQSARIEGCNDVLHQRRCTQQNPGVSADIYVQKENPFSTPIGFGSEYPRAVESDSQLLRDFPKSNPASPNHKQSPKSSPTALSLSLLILKMLRQVSIAILAKTMVELSTTSHRITITHVAPRRYSARFWVGMERKVAVRRAAMAAGFCSESRKR